MLWLLQRENYSDISIERVAAQAKVGKHSIYRWWGSRGELILDAFVEYALQRAAKGSVSNDTFADIERFVQCAYQAWQDPLYEKGLRGLVIEMSFDPQLRQRFNATYLASRKAAVAAMLQHGIELGQVRADIDIGAVVDALYGFIWFHVSFDVAEVDERVAAHQLLTLLRPALQTPPRVDGAVCCSGH